MKFDCWFLGIDKNDWTFAPLHLSYFAFKGSKKKNFAITIMNIVLEFTWGNEYCMCESCVEGYKKDGVKYE